MQAGSAIGSAARHTIGMVAQAFLVVAIIATLAIAAATVVGGGPAGADSVLAAKGGQSVNNGHGGNGGGGTAGTVTGSISVPDGVFGGTTTATVTGGSPWVRVVCSAATGGLVGWATTDGAGLATLQLGPTPSWSSGGASCSAAAGNFDASGNFTVAVSTTFGVSG